MRAINYLLITVFLLAGCTSVFGQDYSKKSVKELLTLAEQNDAEAQHQLGKMYSFGMGVPKNYVLAYKWWNLSAAQGDKNAAEARDKLAKRMTPSQIAEAQKLSRNFKPKKENPKK